LQTLPITYRLSDIALAIIMAWRRLLRVLVILEIFWAALMFGIGLMDGWPLRYAYHAIDWKVLAIGAIAVAVLWITICPVIGYARMKRARVLGPTSYEIVKKGLLVRSPAAESLVFWKTMHRTKKVWGRLFLFISPGGALIVSRRMFDTEAGFEQFVSAVKEQISQSRA
jgi:hypothetical protein